MSKITFKGTIELPVTITETEGYYFVKCKDEIFSNIFASGKTLTKAKKECVKMLKISAMFCEQDSKTLDQRAIFLSNFSRNENDWHLWFKILGLGMTINKYDKSHSNHNPGFWIGNFQFFFNNTWKKHKK